MTAKPTGSTPATDEQAKLPSFALDPELLDALRPRIRRAVELGLELLAVAEQRRIKREAHGKGAS